MWTQNSNTGKWQKDSEKLNKDVYNLLRQELDKMRFYSKCFDATTYLPINNLEDIYDKLKYRDYESWYLGSTTYSVPASGNNEITRNTQEAYSEYLLEDGMTLKNLFTDQRVIDNSIDNYLEVDLISTEEIGDLTGEKKGLFIDGIRVLEGHRVLIKDQQTFVTLGNTIDPDTFFEGNYYVVDEDATTTEYFFYNELNGIYTFRNNRLVKTDELDNYETNMRYSVVAKLGQENFDRQFHLSRLKTGYYPKSSENQPIEFLEKHNWVLRNQVEYQNVLEVNYNDTLKHSVQTFGSYSIPERTVTVGNFGSIINNQNDISVVIKSKFKEDLMGIDEVDGYYWICGQEGTLLKVSKVDFSIESINLDTFQTLNSISFFNNSRGVTVGDYNTIYYTFNGGVSWKKLEISGYEDFIYNKALYYSLDTIYIVGNNGVFLELIFNSGSWTVNKRRPLKRVDANDEFFVVEDIRDIVRTDFNSWSLTYGFTSSTIPSNKEALLMIGNDNTLFFYDVNDFLSDDDYLFISFENNDNIIDLGDLKTAIKRNNDIYVYSEDKLETYKFDINDFSTIDENSNILFATSSLSIEVSELAGDYNKFYNYNDTEMILAGDNSTLKGYTYSLSAYDLDPTFGTYFDSKMLFMDYDVASKTNFFNNDGEYRLPESFFYTTIPDLGTTQLAVHSLPNELSWLDYMKDENKTFIYNTALTTANQVIISTTFSSYAVGGSESNSVVVPDGTYVTQELSDIQNLAPSFVSPTASITATTASYGLYLYENLMILKTDTAITPVELGEVFHMDCSLLSGEFVVNRIEDFGSDRYLYFYSNFDGYLINQLDIISGSISFTNLNRFEETNNQMLVEQFNQHPIKDGYEASFLQEVNEDTSVNFITMDFPTGADDTIYTNWSLVGGFTSSSNFAYNFFPLEETSASYSIQTNNPGVNYVYTPFVNGVDTIQYYYKWGGAGSPFTSGTFSTLKVQGLSASNWDTITNITIPSSVALSGLEVNLSVGEYDRFRFEMFESEGVPSFPGTGPTVSKWIQLDDITLSSVSNINVDLSSYGVSFSSIDALQIDALFNEKTAYYNLQAEVDFEGTVNTVQNMEYTNAFLDFGFYPMYNLEDYLNNVNSTVFTSGKVFGAMPVYNGLPYGNSGVNVSSNKLVFNPGLKFEYDTLWKHTFVNITVDGDSTENTEKLLILKKYYDSTIDRYIVEFSKEINEPTNPTSVDIYSRRTLSEISSDLRELNNIHKGEKEISYGSNLFYNLENELNFKLNTQSYTKIFLSDSDIKKNISAIVYFDDKNQLSLNVIDLGEQVDLEIKNIQNSFGNVEFWSVGPHKLSVGDYVIIEDVENKYSGIHIVKTIINQDKFVTHTLWTGPTTIEGTMKHFIYDEYFNYEPTDIIDVGIDKKGKIAVDIQPENILENADETVSLVNLDLNKYKFKLIDGLSIIDVNENYKWILEAELEDALIGQDEEGNLQWYKGIWHCGRWFGGKWFSGIWREGQWYDGEWYSVDVKTNPIKATPNLNASDISFSTWFDGDWRGGTWFNGTHHGGDWYDGEWNNGLWTNGQFHQGQWLNGEFSGGTWILGNWSNGKFNCDSNLSIWIDGAWSGGDFECGIWKNGTFTQQQGRLSRFGTRSTNSRKSIWESGKWFNGEFHSQLNTDNDGNTIESEKHKFSIWETGTWNNGSWYGGTSYHINWNSGTWYNGVMRQIFIVGLFHENYIPAPPDGTESTLLLKGLWNFNRNETIWIIDNQDSVNPALGTNDNPKQYLVKGINQIPATEPGEEDLTEVYVYKDLSGITGFGYSYNANPPNVGWFPDPISDSNHSLVSYVQKMDWNNGLWENGIFDGDYFRSGMWMNGVFLSGNWT
jgi:hypothetical protein